MRILYGLTALGVLWISGCGGGPKTYKVSGAATYDGVPINEGYIIFRPTSNVDAPQGCEIKDGKYELRVAAGYATVEISALQSKGATGKKGDAIKENIIPALYNKSTKLYAEVSQSGPNQFNFFLDPVAPEPEPTPEPSTSKSSKSTKSKKSKT